METIKNEAKSLDESQSLQIIKEMIDVSRKKLNNNGILLLVWGYAWTVSYLASYLDSTLFISGVLHTVFKYAGVVLPLLALIYTITFIINQSKKATTYISSSLRYVWITLFFSLVIINLIIFNVLKQGNVTLQHPIFMVVLAFAIVVTGIMLRHKYVILGGIAFGLIAYACSFLALRDQMLLEAIAWLIAFIIPGHILYLNRSK